MRAGNNNNNNNINKNWGGYFEEKNTSLVKPSVHEREESKTRQARRERSTERGENIAYRDRGENQEIVTVLFLHLKAQMERKRNIRTRWILTCTGHLTQAKIGEELFML